MSDTKVGRDAFRPEERRLTPQEQRENAFATHSRRASLSAPSAEFETAAEATSGHCWGCATGSQQEAPHKFAVVGLDVLARAINLAIRVGRGTATLKELAEMLAPYGVRRNA